MKSARHLSTEELLLQCDGELSFARLAHLQNCVLCKAALADLEELLSDVERELRATVARESAEQRLASWQALERALYPPSRVGAFPLRWPAVYATAATLTIAVLAGYLSSWQATEPPSQAEVVQAPTRTPSETPTVSLPETPFVASAPGSQLLRASTEPSSVIRTAPRIAADSATPPVPANSAEAGGVVAEAKIPLAQAPERFRFDDTTPARTAIDAGLAVVSSIPQPALKPQLVTGVEWVEIVGAPPDVTAPPPPVNARVAPSKPEFVAALIEGHWILMQAGVWTEDIQPVWTEEGLQLQGTVENAAARRQVTEALTRIAGPAGFSADLQLRPEAPSARALEAAPALIAANERPGGGVVRNSLLAHFSDATRRSFQSPQPAILEAEIDRYVTDVFRSQSRLRAHAYALRSLMRSLPPGQVAQLEPAVVKKFNELVRLHTKALGEDEAYIYDRLSEGLPRRFWTYRASPRDLTTARGWQEESAALLRDVLQLDSTLTALLSTPQSLVDISDSHLSCGELLYRIRGRMRSIRAAADLSR